jgi:hypothetical protein
MYLTTKVPGQAFNKSIVVAISVGNNEMEPSGLLGLSFLLPNGNPLNRHPFAHVQVLRLPRLLGEGHPSDWERPCSDENGGHEVRGVWL